MSSERPVGDYRGDKPEDQFRWQESSFHGARYWVKNYSNKGQGRVEPYSGEYRYVIMDYRTSPPDKEEGFAPSLLEAQRIVDEAFSEMEEGTLT